LNCQHTFSNYFSLDFIGVFSNPTVPPNKSVEPTRVIAVRVIRARQVAGGSPFELNGLSLLAVSRSKNKRKKI
jgi:hypothetical protein